MFHVVLHRSGSDWCASLPLEQQTRWPEHAAFMNALVDSRFIVLGGPLPDQQRVVLAVESDSEEDTRSVLAQDPWSGTHLVVGSVEEWTIRMDGRVP